MYWSNLCRKSCVVQIYFKISKVLKITTLITGHFNEKFDGISTLVLNSFQMSAVQDGLNGCGITQENYQKGLLSLPREIIIRILEKLNSEDLVNIADTCIELRKVCVNIFIRLRITFF